MRGYAAKQIQAKAGDRFETPLTSSNGRPARFSPPPGPPGSFQGGSARPEEHLPTSTPGKLASAGARGRARFAALSVGALSGGVRSGARQCRLAYQASLTLKNWTIRER